MSRTARTMNQHKDKYYAKGVGAVREVPASGDVVLKSHTAK